MSHRSIYMPSSISNSPFATNPKVKQEGFNIPLSSPPSGNPSSTQQPSSSSQPPEGEDNLWSNGLHIAHPSSNATSSSFSHLHKYTSPSSSSYHHYNPSASLDFHETLSSLVGGTAFIESLKNNTSSHNPSNNNEAERGRAPFSNFAFSAPAQNSNSNNNNNNGFSFQPNPPSSSTAAVPTNSRHHSSNDASSNGLQNQHLLNHSLENSSPHSQPSSTTTFSHQSNFSFFDQSNPNGYQSLGGGGYHGHNSASPLSPATSVSLSTTAGFPSAPPSSIRSRSRSSVRTGGGGKAMSSRSRASRKGEGATSPPPPGFNGSLGAAGAPHGRRASSSGLVAPSPSSLTSGGLGLLAMPSSVHASSMPAHLQQSQGGGGGAFDIAQGGGANPSWFFSPSSNGGDGRELPLVEGKESVFGDSGSYSPEIKEVDLVAEGLKAGGKSPEGDDDMDADAKAAEKRRRRRESHNAVERRRRDVINEKISELATLLPECLLDPKASTSSSLNILGANLGVEMMSVVGEEEEDEEEQEPEEEAAPKKKGGKKEKAPPKKKGKSGGAGGGNAIGPDGKPNKGIVLKKSVDYIRYLHQIIQAQSARTAELESALAGLLSQTQSRHSSQSTSDESSHHSSPPDMFGHQPSSVSNHLQQHQTHQQQFTTDPITNQLIPIASGSQSHFNMPQQTYSYSFSHSESPQFPTFPPSSTADSPQQLQGISTAASAANGGTPRSTVSSPSMMFQSWTGASEDPSPTMSNSGSGAASAEEEERGRARERWGVVATGVGGAGGGNNNTSHDWAAFVDPGRRESVDDMVE